MKKILLALLLVVTVFLAGCDPVTDDKDKTSDPSDPTDPGTDPGDDDPFVPLEGIDEALILSMDGVFEGDFDGVDKEYYFYLPEELTVVLSLEAEFDSIVVIKDFVTSQIVFEGDDSIYGDDIYTIITLDAGEYVLELSSYENEGGSFSLSMGLENTLPVIIVGETISNTFLGDEIHGYLLEVSEASYYRIFSTSELDLEGVITSLEGEFLAYNDDRDDDDEDFELLVFLEAGSYILGATTYYGETGGQYELLVESYTVSHTTSITENTSINDILLSGEKNVVEFTVTSDGYVELYLESNFDSYGTLYDAAGEIVAENDDAYYTSDFYINEYLEAGTYTIEVSSFSDYDGGSYELFYNYSEEMIEETTIIELNNMYEGSILEDQTSVYELTILEGQYVDFYLESNYDMVLEIYNINGDYIAFDDDSGTDLNSALYDLYLVPDIYYIYVKEFSNAPVDYYEFYVFEGSNTVGDYPIITLGGYIVDSLTDDDTDVYQLIIKSGQYVDLYTNSDDDMVLSVYDADGELVGYNDDGAIDGDSEIDDLYLDAGVYYIYITEYTYNPVDYYELHVYSDGGSTVVEYISIELNTYLEDSLAINEVDIFELTVTEGQYVNIYTTGEYDMYVEIYDEYGTFIAYNDDSGIDMNSSFENVYLSPGVYYIYVEEFDGSLVDYYELHIEDADWSEPVVYTEIAINGYVTDSLAPNETAVFQLTLLQDLSVDIFTEGTSDLLLVIYDAEGNEVAYDDDSGTNNNSAVNDLYLTAGVYYIYIEEYSYSAVDYYEVYAYSNFGPPTIFSNITLDSSVVDSLLAGVSNAYELTILEDTFVDLYTNGLHEMMIWVYDEDGNFVAFDSQSGVEGNAFLDDLYLEVGVYYIYVAEYYGVAVDAYELHVESVDSELPSGDISIEVDEYVTGSLIEGETDYFVLTILEGQYVDIYTISADDMMIEIYNSYGELIEYAYDYEDDFIAAMNNLYLSEGVYYIYVEQFAYMAVDSYELYVDSSGLYTSVAVGDSVTGSLLEGEYGLFELIITTGQYVDIFTISDYDLYLEIYSDDLQFITYDDDSGFDGNSAISDVYLVPGVYYIFVSEFNISAVDTYELYVRAGDGTTDDDYLNTRVGISVTNSLETGEEDIFQLIINQGQYVDIYTSTPGTLYDLVVEIYDRFGNFVAFDDDSGVDGNSAFYNIYLEPNIYYIYVAGYDLSFASYYELHIYPVAD